MTAWHCQDTEGSAGGRALQEDSRVTSRRPEDVGKAGQASVCLTSSGEGDTKDKPGASAQMPGWALSGRKHRQVLPGHELTPHVFLQPRNSPGVSILPVASLDHETLWTLTLRVGLGQRGGPQGISDTCHSRTPTPAPSRPAHLLRNVPLQPLRGGQHRVGCAQTMPSLRVAQVEAVGAQDKLQGQGQAERPSLPCCPGPRPAPALRDLSQDLLPPRGAL